MASIGVSVHRNPIGRSAALLVTLALATGCGGSAQTRGPGPGAASDGEGAGGILLDLGRWDRASDEARRAAAAAVQERLPDFSLVGLQAFSCGGVEHEIAVFRHARTGLEFSLIPAGTFVMGSPPGEGDEEGRANDETPHNVTLTRPYLISRTECTEEAWDRVGGNDHRRWHEPRMPIENVTWTDCVEWCRKAGLELPTEAQWEYACRAGTTSRWCVGDDKAKLSTVTWYGTDTDYPMRVVAQKLPNAFGLYDVHGNVWEWCWDLYGEYSVGGAKDPTGPADDEGGYRVVRGGIWYDPGIAARSALRNSCPGGSNWRGDQTGFRPAKVVRE